MTDRRLQRYAIAENDILDWFANAAKGWPASVCLPMLELPADAKVLSVHHDWQCKRFDFTVASETFDEVPDGAMIPDAMQTCQWTFADIMAKGEYQSFITDPRKSLSSVMGVDWGIGKDCSATYAAAELRDYQREQVDEIKRKIEEQYNGRLNAPMVLMETIPVRAEVAAFINSWSEQPAVVGADAPESAIADRTEGDDLMAFFKGT